MLDWVTGINRFNRTYFYSLGHLIARTDFGNQLPFTVQELQLGRQALRWRNHWGSMLVLHALLHNME
ncbi:hypothetical protein D3C76_1336970 [compost metagenome]